VLAHRFKLFAELGHAPFRYIFNSSGHPLHQLTHLQPAWMLCSACICIGLPLAAS
jgi:hypothetical protein